MSRIFISFLLALPAARAQFPPFTDLRSGDHPGTNYLGSPSGEFGAAGAAVAGGLDVNRSGVPDIIVGAPGSRQDQPGRAFLILDRPGGPRDVNLGGGSGIVSILSGSSTEDQLGAAVASAGDVDGDGFDDFLIGIPRSAEAPGGVAALIFGKGQFSQRITLSSDIPRLGLIFLGQEGDASTGEAVAGVGDVNGDGFPDFAIGSPRASRAGPDTSRTGRMYLIFGGPGLRALQSQGNGRVDLSLLAPGSGIAIDGPDDDGLFGASIAGAGDLDGDGIADLAVGAPEMGRGGSVFLLFGRRDIAPPDLSSPDGSRAVRVDTANDRSGLGAALAGGRDVTGDRVPDLLIGAPGVRREGMSTPGAAILLAGGARLRGQPAIDVTLPQPGIHHLLGVANDQVGDSVALASDVDGDSIDDLLIGGPMSRNRRGVAYLTSGSAALPTVAFLYDLGTVFLNDDSEAGVGSAVAGLGDRDGDGLGDIAIGASGIEIGGRDGAGAVYEVLAHPGNPGGAPRNLNCRILPGRNVQLSWINSARYSSLSLLRDGFPLASPAPEDLFFIDTDPLPGEHVYRVQANGDPLVVSKSCKVALRTLPVNDLSCVQIPGSTRVRLSWGPGDHYEHLAVLLDGQVIRNDLSGHATSFEFDPGPGLFEFEVSDPEDGHDAFSASCQIQVIPFGGSSITGLDCNLVETDEDRSVDLSWDANPVFDRFLVKRDGTVLDTVEETSFKDEDPPGGLRTYQVIGFAEKLHPSAPATCSVQVPGEGGQVLRGRVRFADLSGTPIHGGRVRAFDAARKPLGTAQPDGDGEFGIAVSGGSPASIVYETTLPSLDDDDQAPSHFIQVEVPASLGASVDLEVPVPVVAIAGLNQGATRWDALIERLEGLRGPDGRPRGTLAFGFKGKGDVARSAKAIDAAIGKVRDHLRTYLAAEPDQVDLIAHGFSGLAARAYVQGSPGGGQPLRTLILLGTPNLGSSLAGLDAQAAAPERFSLIGPEGREEDLFTAAGEQSPEYLEEFNRRITNRRGALVHLVAGLGGNPVLQSVLGCADHDGRICRASALGGVPGAATHTTGDVHENLGHSAASIDLIAGILIAPGEAGGGSPASGGGQVTSPFESGNLFSSVLTESATSELSLYSDTSGSVIIILNNQSPGVIDFTVQTPDGTQVDPAKAGALPGVSYQTFGDGEGHLIQSYEFEAGQVGIYTAIVQNPSPTLRVPYSVQIYLDSNLTLSGNLSPGDVAVGEGTMVTAAVALNGAPLAGASAEARINRPDGGSDVIPLRDDGRAPDLAQGDGIHSASYAPSGVAGLYSLTVRASGSTPFPFLREESLTLLVRSGAAAFQGAFTSGDMDFQPDGILDGLWVEGAIQTSEAGLFMVVGKLTDLDGNHVADGALLFGQSAPGPASFRISFFGKDIASSGREGPYLLKEVEVLDGNRGFLLCERRTDALTTAAYTLKQFGVDPPPRFIRGDANADGEVNLSDAVAILWGLFLGDTIDCTDSADANADLAFNLSDAIFLLGVFFQGAGQISEPYPACGSAPALGCTRFDICP